VDVALAPEVVAEVLPQAFPVELVATDAAAHERVDIGFQFGDVLDEAGLAVLPVQGVAVLRTPRDETLITPKEFEDLIDLVGPRRRGCGEGSDIRGRVVVDDDRLPDDGRSGLRRESGSRSRLGRVTDLLLGGDDVVDVAVGAGRGRGLDDRPTGSRDVASLDEAGDDVPDVLLDGRFDGVERVERVVERVERVVERVPGRLDGGAGVRDGVGVCHLVSPVVWAGPGGPL